MIPDSSKVQTTCFFTPKTHHTPSGHPSDKGITFSTLASQLPSKRSNKFLGQKKGKVAEHPSLTSHDQSSSNLIDFSEGISPWDAENVNVLSVKVMKQTKGKKQ